MSGERVLIADHDENQRFMLSVLLKKEGYDVDVVDNGKQALALLETHPYDAVLSDLRLPIMDGLTFLQKAHQTFPDLPVIMCSSGGGMSIAREVMREGAQDYLSKPLRTDDVLLAIGKAIERRKHVPRAHAAKSPEGTSLDETIVTKNQKMLDIFTTIKKIKEYKTTVLILGESGTGKEMIAKAIHASSSRAKQNFVTINCGAIPENLLESELFGHAKGAFTGAQRQKKGLFEEADNGTIFLDEIGELPLLLQVKLLRALQEEEIRRVGENTPVQVNVRIIAATLKDLSSEIEKGNFREDLYYRLNVLPLQLPPLRERKEDIPLLVGHFIKKFNQRMGVAIETIDTDALSLLLHYDWPGNIRELENTVERAMVLTAGSTIAISSIPSHIASFSPAAQNLISLTDDELSIKKYSKALEIELIQKALAKTNGNRTKAAKLLEISHRALIYKIQDYGLGES